MNLVPLRRHSPGKDEGSVFDWSQGSLHRAKGRIMKIGIVIGMLVVSGAVLALAQDQPSGTQAEQRPAQPARPTAPDPDAMLKQLLTPALPAARPLEPVPDSQAFDRLSGMAVGARPEPRPLVREGEIIAQRVGRLTRMAEGHAEFVFEADGQALRDPPMIILPNRKLEQMELMVERQAKDLRFLISGIVTEYRGRNHILIETVSVPTEPPVR